MPVRVVAARIEQDRFGQRCMASTARTLAVPPPYSPVPGALSTTSAWMTARWCWPPSMTCAGPLLDLVTAVLAIGEACYHTPPGSTRRAQAPARACPVDHVTGWRSQQPAVPAGGHR